MKRVHEVALASALTLGGLTGCDQVSFGNKPIPLPGATLQQQRDCNDLGQQIADQAQGNIDRATPGIGRTIVNGVTGNNPTEKPNLITLSESRKREIVAQCIEQARYTNRDAALAAAAKAERAAAPAVPAPALDAAPAPVDAAPAPVAAAPVNSGPATPLPPVETVSPTMPAIGKLPPYFDGAVVSKDQLDKNSFGDANLKVLAKTLMTSCNHGGCAAAPAGQRDQVLQGQFTAQTAMKFGMGAQDAADPVQAVVAAGKLQVYNNKALTELSGGKAPEDYQLSLANKFGKDAVAALVANPAKSAAEVMTTAYNGNANAANDAITSIVADSPNITAKRLLELARSDYENADAKNGVGNLNAMLAKSGRPPIDSTTMRNTAGTSLDQVGYGKAAPAAQSDAPLGTKIWNRIMYGQQQDSAASAVGR